MLWGKFWFLYNYGSTPCQWLVKNGHVTQFWPLRCEQKSSRGIMGKIFFFSARFCCVWNCKGTVTRAAVCLEQSYTSMMLERKYGKNWDLWGHQQEVNQSAQEPLFLGTSCCIRYFFTLLFEPFWVEFSITCSQRHPNQHLRKMMQCMICVSKLGTFCGKYWGEILRI